MDAKCSLCSRTFPRHDLRYTPVGGGVRHQYSDYLCRQCWSVLSPGQPWPEQTDSGSGGGGGPQQRYSGSPPSPDGGRPPRDRRQLAQQYQQQQAAAQQQQYHAAAAAAAQGSPLSVDALQRSISAPMSGITAGQAAMQVPQSNGGYQQLQLAGSGPSVQQSPFGSGHGGMLAQAALGRRSQSFADFQLRQAAAQAGGAQPQGMPIGGAGFGGQGQQRRPWQPASMPEQPVLLGSSDDPRWGSLAHAASASGSDMMHHQRSGRMGIGIAGGRMGAHGQHMAGGGGASAPVHPGLLAGSMHHRPQFGSMGAEIPGGMLDEASLELFESQSHLLDPDSRAALAKQRQLLDWQAGQAGSGGDEAHTLAASLERQDSAGSGNEPLEVSNIKRQLRSALTERDAQTSKANELQAQLQDKKRQLFSAIQEREGLRQQARQLEDRCREFQEMLQCKMCKAVQRNCVVLPCLHFLYCDNCFKQHCASSPTCPACNCGVTGFQTLIMHR